MLVLSRKAQESIFIGDVEVKVVAIEGNKVRIGITAPRDVPVFRKEIYVLIHPHADAQEQPAERAG